MNWKNNIYLIRATPICILLFILSSTLKGQTVNGVITDTLNKHIPYATITLSNAGVILYYTTSNEKGEYIIQRPADIRSSVSIEVSCIGYVKQTKIIADGQSTVNFSLQPGITELQSVTVRGNHPIIRTTGDTISYKASDFAVTNDRVIGDVLKRVPGIDVSPEGKISYNGKAISNFYIDGDNLLDDKYNIATNTIPNGIVDKIQVLENHQPIKLLQKREVSDNVALNLTIKEDAKLNVVGQESIGGGLPQKYFADLNALLLKKTVKAINYIKANNVGVDLENDLISQNSADYFKRIDNVRPSPIASIGSTTIPDIEREKYLFNQSGIINLNDLVNLKNQYQVKINSYYLINNQTQNFFKTTNIYLPRDTIKYTESQSNQFKPAVFHNQININSNQTDFYLNDNLIADYNRNTNISNLISGQIPISQHLSDNLTNFSNEFDFLKTTKATKDIIEIYAYVNHFTEPQEMVIEPGLNPLIFNNGAPFNQLIQNVNSPNWMINSYISYNKKSAASNYTLKLGAIIQSQQLSSQLRKTEPNGLILPAVDSSTNALKWRRNKFYLENGYSYILDKFEASVKVPIFYQSIAYGDPRYLFDGSLTHFFINTEAFTKLRVGQENAVELSYRYTNYFGTIQDVYKGYILKDYRTLTDNNAPVGKSYNQSVSLFYTYKNSVSLFFYYVGLSFSTTAADNITSSVISNTLQQRITLPFPNTTNLWTLNSTISKYLFDLHTSFSLNISLISLGSNQIQNSLLLPYTTFTKSVVLKIESKLSNNLNIGYRGEFRLINSATKGIADKTDDISQFHQRASLNYNTSKSFIFTVSDDNYLIHSTGSNPLYNFLDLTSRYVITKSKIEFNCSLMNVLNNTSYTTINLSGNTYSSSTYSIPGRYILFKVNFNL